MPETPTVRTVQRWCDANTFRGGPEVIATTPKGETFRITAARSRANVLQGKRLSDGRWYAITTAVQSR